MWRRLALDMARIGAGTALSFAPVRQAHRRLRGQSGRRVVIFYYHRVYRENSQPVYQLGIQRDLFRRQIADLARSHRFVPLMEALEAAKSGASGPDLASLTFDDGYRDNLTEALPVLREFDVPATIFVVAGAIEGRAMLWYDEVKIVCERAQGPRLALPSSLGGDAIEIPDLPARRRAFGEIMGRIRKVDDAVRREAVPDLVKLSRVDTSEFRERDALLTWDEAREMEHHGIRFASHTLSHPILPRISDAQCLRAELEAPMRLLEKRVAHPVPVFAYPEGRWSEEVGRAVAEAGYRYAVISMPGDVTAGDDPFRIPRRGFGPVSSTFAGKRHTRAILVAESEGWFDLVRRRRTRRHVTNAAAIEADRTVARQFDTRANAYQSGRRGDPAFEGEVGEIFRMMPQKQGVLLEIGCGVGIASLRMASRGWNVVATDIALEMVKRTRENAGAEGKPLIGVVRCDAKHLPFKGRAAQAVVCHGVLEYVGDVPAAAAEISRVLESGGGAVATIPSRLAPAMWAAAVLGLVSRARPRRRPSRARVQATHLFPWGLDGVAEGAGLVRREGIPSTFGFLPAGLFPRQWLALNNRIVSALPRWWVFRWWGSQYIARYDKNR